MNTLEFIKDRAINCSNLAIADWDNAKVIPNDKYANEKLCNPNGIDIALPNGEQLHVIFKYDPNAEFEYFTHARYLHDGTLAFMLNTIETCMNNIFLLKTYDVRKCPPAPNGTIIYTFGDAVMINEIAENIAPPDKKWAQVCTTVCVPLIYEFQEHNNGN